MPADEAESNKAAVGRFHDAMNAGGAELVGKTVDEFVAPDAAIRTPLPVGATGAEVLKVVFGRLYAAFPDLHVAIDDLIAEGDKVVSMNTVTELTGASSWASRQPEKPSRTGRSSSSASPTAGSPRPGESSTSWR